MTFDLFTLQGLALCAAFFFAGVVDAVCGGGGLITLPVFMMTGFPTHMITGTNQCGIIAGSLTSFLKYRHHGCIHWATALPVVPLAMLGAFLGARLNMILPADTLRWVMIVLLPVVAALVLIHPREREKQAADTLTPARILLSSVAIGLIVGAYQGFYGAGAGAFYMLAFAALDRLDLITASGNTKLVSLCSVVTAGLTYALSGQVVWTAVLAVSVSNIAGNYLGAALAIRRGSRVIRPMLFAILGVLFIRLVLERVMGA